MAIYEIGEEGNEHSHDSHEEIRIWKMERFSSTNLLLILIVSGAT